MRAASVVSEAGRNLLSGTTHAVMLALLLMVGVGALAVLDTRAVVDVLRQADTYRGAGAATWMLQDLGHIDGARCDALSHVDGVRAGALRQGRPVSALALPSSRLKVWEVTPGLVPLATGRAVGDGIWLSDDLADDLGTSAGDTLATSLGDVSVAGVYPWADDGRDRALGYAALLPVPPTGRFDACWASVWPPDEDIARLLYSTTDAHVDSDATFGQLNTSLGAELDAVGALRSRDTRPAPVAAAVLGLLLGWTAVRLRRLQVAGALHARVPRADLAWQHLLEALVWVLCGTLLAAAACTWAATAGNPDPGGATLAVGLRVLGAGACGALLGTLVAVVTTREKHLFRYFKDR